MRSSVVVVALSFLAACSGAHEPTTSPDAVVDVSPGPTAVVATATTTATALPRKDAPPPSALDAWTLPGGDGPKIGEPCPPPHENAPAAGVVTPCGNAGRVSVEYQPYRPLMGKAPCEMRSFGGRPQMVETRACVDGDHAVFSSVCMMCRSMSGWSAHVRLSELAPDQSKALFARIGSGEDVEAPTTPEAWRAWISKAAPIASP